MGSAGRCSVGSGNWAGGRNKTEEGKKQAQALKRVHWLISIVGLANVRTIACPRPDNYASTLLSNNVKEGTSRLLHANPRQMFECFGEGHDVWA